MFAEDLSVFFDDDMFAEPASYNGADIDVIEDVSTPLALGDTGEPGFVVPVFRILVKAEDVPVPMAGDAVVFRTKKFRVGGRPFSEAGVWRVDLFEKSLQV